MRTSPRAQNADLCFSVDDAPTSSPQHRNKRPQHRPFDDGKIIDIIMVVLLHALSCYTCTPVGFILSRAMDIISTSVALLAGRFSPWSQDQSSDVTYSLMEIATNAL